MQSIQLSKVYFYTVGDFPFIQLSLIFVVQIDQDFTCFYRYYIATKKIVRDHSKLIDDENVVDNSFFFK